MELPDIKQLRAIVKECRKLGVASIRLGDVEIQLGAPIAKLQATAKAPIASTAIQDDLIETDTLTDDQLLFYSVGELPASVTENS